MQVIHIGMTRRVKEEEGLVIDWMDRAAWK